MVPKYPRIFGNRFRLILVPKYSTTPVLFIMYTTPLTNLIDSHAVQHEMFADATQINDSNTPDNYPDLISSLQECVADVSAWMQKNKLKLNDDKTEAMRFSCTTPTYADAISDLPQSIS